MTLLIRRFQTGGAAPMAPAQNLNNKKLTTVEMRALPPEQFSQLDHQDIYNVRLEEYKNWKNGYRNTDKYSYKLSPQEIDAWAKQQGNQLVYTGKPTQMWVGKNPDGTPNYNEYFPQYEQPNLKQIQTQFTKTPQTQTNANPPATTTGGAVYLHPYTSQPLDPNIYGKPEGAQINVQLAQGIDMMSLQRKQANAEKEKQAAAAKAANEQALLTMTEEQKADMRAKNLTPIQYLQTMSVAHFQTGGTVANPAASNTGQASVTVPSVPEYQTKMYNGRPYNKLGINEKRILDYRYGYSGYSSPDGTIIYEKWPEGQGVGENYYGKSTIELNKREKENGTGTYSAHNKYAYMVDPESKTTWFINNQYLGDYPVMQKGSDIQQHKKGGILAKKSMACKCKKGGLLY